MAEWGGPRPGAGRKANGTARVSISTRISAESSARLRALAGRSGLTLGQVLDALLSYAAAQPDFERIIHAAPEVASAKE